MKKLLWAVVLSALPLMANANCDPNGKFDLNACRNDAAGAKFGYQPFTEKPDFSRTKFSQEVIDACNNDWDDLDFMDMHACRQGKMPKTKAERQAQRALGRWVLNTQTDPMTDHKIYTATVPGQSTILGYHPTRLIIRCENKKMDIYVDWNAFLGNLSKTTVVSRLDKLSAETLEWPVSTNLWGTFHPNPIPVLKKMTSAAVFRVQATPYNSNPIRIDFPVQGADTAFADMRKACKW